MHLTAIRRRITARGLQTVVLLTSTLLATGLAAPAAAQTAVKARSTSLAPNGLFTFTTNATIDNGVLTAHADPGGSATGGPTGAGVTSAFTETHQNGFVTSPVGRNDSYASVDLPTGILRSLVSHTPVNIYTMGIANTSFEEGVYFVNSSGAPITLPVRWRVPGVVVPNGPGIGYQGVFATIRFNESGYAFGIPMPALLGTAGHTELLTYENVAGVRRFYNPQSGKGYPLGTSPTWQIDPLGAYGAVMDSAFIVPVGLSKMQVVASLNVDCRAGVICDFHTEGVSFQFGALPPGLAMASDSGTFFGAPKPSAAPSGLTVVSIVGNRVTLRWTPPTTALATNFVMEGGLGPGQVLGSLATGGTATTFTFDAPTGSFYLRIRAVTAAGQSAASNEVLVHVNVPQPPAAPTHLLGLVNGADLALSWKNSGAGGVPTSVLLDVSGPVAASVPLGVTETFSFSGVPPGTYTFAVRATNATGTSAASPPVTLTFPGTCSGVPQAPANFAVTKTGSQVAIAWDPPTTGPAIGSYVLKVAGALSLAVPFSGRSIGGAVPPGSYTFSVLATNPCGVGAETAPQTVVVP